jgi:superfamily II DNA helicase RecQ
VRLAHRPAYFRLGRALADAVPCRALLALTATATRAAQADIVRGLGISPECVFCDASLRANLRLHVRHANGGAALLSHLPSQQNTVSVGFPCPPASMECMKHRCSAHNVAAHTAYATNGTPLHFKCIQ